MWEEMVTSLTQKTNIARALRVWLGLTRVTNLAQIVQTPRSEITFEWIFKF